MLFAAVLKIKAGTSQERVARRMKWKIPGGMKPVAEYWLQTVDPHVISIFEADSVAPIMEIFAGWDDFFDITVTPAVTAEDGLERAKQMMQE